MSKITNPHDKFLKAMLSDIAAAREFMAHFLPADVVGILDLTTLKPVKESFLTGKMKELFSDLIFECRLKTTFGDVILFIAILIEHKSSPEKYRVARQALREYSDGTIPVRRLSTTN